MRLMPIGDILENLDLRYTLVSGGPRRRFLLMETMKDHWRSILLFSALFVSVCGCSTNSTSEVRLPDGTHCRYESTGFFLWPATSIACVDKSGAIIGSYSSN